MDERTQHLIFNVMVPELTEIVQSWSIRQKAPLSVILTALGASVTSVVCCLETSAEEKKEILDSFCETMKKSLAYHLKSHAPKTTES